MSDFAPASVRAVLFDLGNVVIDIDFMRAFEIWARLSGREASELRRAFQLDEAYERHERGEIDERVYFESLRRSLGIDLEHEQLLEGWNAILLEEKPDIRDLIAAASRKHPVYLFTNTNAAHQRHWSRAHPELLSMFKELFVSSELGLRKPERAAYLAVTEKMDVAPTEVLFFDDSLANIEGARDIGIQAVHTTSTDTVREALAALT